MTFFTQNPDLMLCTFAILVILLIMQTVRVAIHKNNCMELSSNIHKKNKCIDTLFNDFLKLTMRLADAENIINSLRGHEVNTRDLKTGRFVSYKRVVKNILQYENKYFKKDKSACQ